MDRDNQFGIFWYQRRKNPDGSVRTFYSGVDTRKDGKLYLFENKRSNVKENGNWNLTITVKDEITGRDKWLVIGHLWNKTPTRTEGYLIKNKQPIVTFKSEKKMDRISEAEAEKNSGIITEEEYRRKLENIKKMPDICIYYDKSEEQEKNRINYEERKLNSKVKVTEEEERAILEDEDIDEDYEDDYEVPYQ